MESGQGGEASEQAGLEGGRGWRREWRGHGGIKKEEFLLGRVFWGLLRVGGQGG